MTSKLDREGSTEVLNDIQGISCHTWIGKKKQVIKRKEVLVISSKIPFGHPGHTFRSPP